MYSQSSFGSSTRYVSTQPRMRVSIGLTGENHAHDTSFGCAVQRVNRYTIIDEEVTYSGIQWTTAIDNALERLEEGHLRLILRPLVEERRSTKSVVGLSFQISPKDCVRGRNCGWGCWCERCESQPSSCLRNMSNSDTTVFTLTRTHSPPIPCD